MRLSAFTVVDDYPDLGPGRGRLREVVGLAEACEAAGLHALWVAEHHFQPAGVCPAPPVLLAAAGARTHRLRLGVMVSVLPFHAPIDLAEQYAQLDQLLDGRLELGVGSGYIPLEFAGHGLDPAGKREQFERHLEVMLAAFRGEEVRAEGPLATPVRINVRPVQRPHPPLRIAVQRRVVLPELAKRGWSIALIPYATVSGLPELAEEIREYRAALPTGVAGGVAVAVHLYAGPELAEARGALQRYLDARRATQSVNYLERVREDPRRAGAEEVERQGFALFGSPEEVAARTEEFARIGVDELLGIFDFGGLDPGLVRSSVGALARARAGR